MPLPEPVERELMHVRRVECRGYRRADGLWDIEGRLHDSRTYPYGGPGTPEVPAGSAIHTMLVRLTFDDELVIKAATATTEAGPYPLCRDAAPGIAKLVGLRIKAGWMAEVDARIGGIGSCTHIRELLGPMATTLYQTLYPVMNNRYHAGEKTRATTRFSRPPFDTCYALARDREVVQTYFADHAESKPPARR
jgi:hypothetical protein